MKASMRRAFWALWIGVICACDPDTDLAGGSHQGGGAALSGGDTTKREVIAESDVAGFIKRADEAPRLVSLQQIAVYGGDGAHANSGGNSDARVVLRFDGPAVYRRSELAEEAGMPRRLVLDLDGASVGPDVSASQSVGGGGLARVRTFALDQERVRVAFDVARDTAYRLFSLNDPYRIVMDFRGAAPTKQAVAERPLLIVLDPGHGGDQPGAKGPDGLRESNVALAIARKVRSALRRELPQARVVMTRDDGRFVSLEERAAIANALDADMFVSIHLDASPAQSDPGGVSAYVLDTTDDKSALSLAARENGTPMDREAVSQLQMILASLYRKEQVERSHELAEAVERGALRGGRRLLPDLNDRGVQRALFYVLMGARMPAVLLEASFISRPEEARALATDQYRQSLADGIAEGIARYVERDRVSQALLRARTSR